MYWKVSREFKESFKWVSRKLKKKKLSRVFHKVLFCDFFVAWLSSKLPVKILESRIYLCE